MSSFSSSSSASLWLAWAWVLGWTCIHALLVRWQNNRHQTFTKACRMQGRKVYFAPPPSSRKRRNANSMSRLEKGRWTPRVITLCMVYATAITLLFAGTQDQWKVPLRSIRHPWTMLRVLIMPLTVFLDAVTPVTLRISWRALAQVYWPCAHPSPAWIGCVQHWRSSRSLVRGFRSRHGDHLHPFVLEPVRSSFCSAWDTVACVFKGMAGWFFIRWHWHWPVQPTWHPQQYG